MCAYSDLYKILGYLTIYAIYASSETVSVQHTSVHEYYYFVRLVRVKCTLSRLLVSCIAKGRIWDTLSSYPRYPWVRNVHPRSRCDTDRKKSWESKIGRTFYRGFRFVSVSVCLRLEYAFTAIYSIRCMSASLSSSNRRYPYYFKEDYRQLPLLNPAFSQRLHLS